jgi:Leucine-rich repeat (LRR) protein
LNDTKITDAGVAFFVELKNLRSLSLTRTGITDQSVPYLKTLTWLTRLDIQSVKITPDGYNQLKAALPNCLIYYY